MGCKCISVEYVNAKSILKFICQCGNPFNTCWSNFQSGHKIKCDICTNNPRANRDYNTVKTNLEKYGYYLDINPDDYHGVTLTPLICHDKDGYKYKVVYDAILVGKRPNKVSISNPFSIENINLFLKINNKDFTCISSQYLGSKELLEFICNRCGEHIFAKWRNMNKSDNPNRNILLCPNCDGRTESVHALVLKQLFKYYYPDTIEEDNSCINPITGKIIPTDIVNHNLKIAIEVQSEWHDNEYSKIKDKIKKDYWINRNYNFYSPDIRDYSVLEMCQLFFNIDVIPDFINFEYSNKLNLKKVQELLNKDISPVEIADILNIKVHRIYDAIGYGKLHYSSTYINDCYVPIVQLNINQNYMNRYSNITQAAKENNIIPGNIVSTLVDGRNYSCGYYWVKEEDYISGNYSIKISRIAKFMVPVDRYDMSDNFVCHFNTIFEASKDCKSTNYEIYRVASGKRTSSYGYKYKFSS